MLDQRAGPDLAADLNNLALLYRNQGRLKEAEPLYTRSLAVIERVMGSNHPDVAKTLNAFEDALKRF